MAVHKHIHRRILYQLAIFPLAAIGIVVSVVLDAMAGQVGVLPLLVAAIAGLAIGYVVGRMFLITWHEDTRKVIMRMDKMGILLLVAYIAFRMASATLLGDYFSGAALSAISFAVLDGILVGRFVSIWRSVVRILREQGIIT